MLEKRSCGVLAGRDSHWHRAVTVHVVAHTAPCQCIELEPGHLGPPPCQTVGAESGHFPVSSPLRSASAPARLRHGPGEVALRTRHRQARRRQEPPAPLTPSQWQAAAGGKPRRLGVGVAPARTYGHGKPGTVQASAPLATCGIRADGPFGHTASGSQLEPTNRNGFKPGMGFRLLQQNDQCWAHTTAGLPLRCIVRRPPSPISVRHKCSQVRTPLWSPNHCSRRKCPPGHGPRRKRCVLIHAETLRRHRFPRLRASTALAAGAR